jgi:hypothetical protein
VKHYSSGMSARLGFAIAVHSPARLLLVDEVLSVGDKLFQQKCLARMHELRDSGTTIVLVSHDDAWIRNFCTRALLIDAGRVVADTTPVEALREYDLRLYKDQGESSDGVSIAGVKIFDPEDREIGSVPDAAIRVRIDYDARGAKRDWVLVAHVRREDGFYTVFCLADGKGMPSLGTAVLEIEQMRLVVGRYCIEASIEDAATHEALVTRVSDPFYVDGVFDAGRGYPGIVRVDQRWSFEA